MTTRARRAATRAPIVIDSGSSSEEEASDPEGIFASPDAKPKGKAKKAAAPRKRGHSAGSDEDSDFEKDLKGKEK